MPSASRPDPWRRQKRRRRRPGPPTPPHNTSPEPSSPQSIPDEPSLINAGLVVADNDNGWQWVQWARTQTVGSSGAKAVLNAIATYADWKTGTCKLKQETLSAHTEMGVTTVRAHLSLLDRDGFISRRKRGAQGMRLADEITLTPGPSNPLPAKSSASERSTTGGFSSTTGRKEASLPLKSAGGTPLSEHANHNSPSGDASHEVLGRAASELPALPSSEQVQAATGLLQQYNCYGNGLTIQEIWDSFRSHAETSRRTINHLDKAWMAWVGGFVDRERAKAGIGPRPKSQRQGAL